MATHLQTWKTYWLNGGSSGPASGFDVQGEIRVYLNSQSLENNTSSIYIDHYVYAQVTDSSLGVVTSITSRYRGNNGSNGGTYKSVTKEISVDAGVGKKSYYIGRTTHTITHNADGSARLYINGSISSDGKSTTSGFNKALPTIPRASTVTATRAYIGETSQITVTKKNESYTHSIQYWFGSLKGYILADGTTADEETKITEKNIGFTIPTSFYTQIPNDKEGLCTLTIKTYNGETQIGDKQISTFYAEVINNETNQPNLTVNVVDINEKTKALTDVDTKLIKGYSTARVTYSASGKNSASVKSVTINGVTVASSPKDLANFSENTIEVVATDSRTFSTKKVPTYTLVEYFEPTISIRAKRTAPTENEIKLSFSGNLFNGNFGTVANALSLSWVYRIKGATSWATGGTLTKGTHYVISGNTFHSGTGSYESEISLGKLFSYENTYEIGVVYSDKLFEPKTTVTTISKGKPVINWKEKMVNINGELNINEKNIKENFTSINSIEPEYNEKIWLQKTKNLFPLPASQTINGVSLTNNGNGTFNLTGTATGDVKFSIDKIYSNAQIISGEIYTLSTSVAMTSDVFVSIENYNGNSWYSNEMILNSGTKLSKAINLFSGADRLRMSIRVASGKTVNLLNVKLQLEEGNTATEMQPVVYNKIYIKNNSGKYVEIINLDFSNNLQYYSTAEQIVGAWIDGKPLYRRTMFATISASKSADVGSISNIDYVEIIKGNTIFENGGNEYSVPLSTYETSTNFSKFFVQKNVSTNLATIKWAGNSTSGIVYATVEYTKVTD